MRALISFGFLLLFASCNSESKSKKAKEDFYEEAKMSLEDEERGNPAQFLKVSGTYRKNIVGQWILEGQVSNTAKVATYKDVVLNFVYFTKTETELGSENKTMYEYFKPGHSKKFKIKTYSYSNAWSIGFGVETARAVHN